MREIPGFSGVYRPFLDPRQYERRAKVEYRLDKEPGILLINGR
jgi:hypothetical protein